MRADDRELRDGSLPRSDRRGIPRRTPPLHPDDQPRRAKADVLGPVGDRRERIVTDRCEMFTQCACWPPRRSRACSRPSIFPSSPADGKTYSEMHVDGGVTAQLVFVPPEAKVIEIEDKVFKMRRARDLWVIRNSKIAPEYRARRVARPADHRPRHPHDGEVPGHLGPRPALSLRREQQHNASIIAPCRRRTRPSRATRSRSTKASPPNCSSSGEEVGAEGRCGCRSRRSRRPSSNRSRATSCLSSRPSRTRGARKPMPGTCGRPLRDGCLPEHLAHAGVAEPFVAEHDRLPALRLEPLGLEERDAHCRWRRR